MKKITPTLDMTVDHVMGRWPASIRVFLDFKMKCIGCPIATFHSVAEASCEHDIDAEILLAALRAVADAAEEDSLPSPAQRPDIPGGAAPSFP